MNRIVGFRAETYAKRVRFDAVHGVTVFVAVYEGGERRGQATELREVRGLLPDELFDGHPNLEGR